MTSITKKDGKTDSTIDFFGQTFTVSHSDYQTSRHSVAAIALTEIFKVNYPHWKAYNPFGDVKLKSSTSNGTTAKTPNNENDHVTDPCETEPPTVTLSPDKKLSPEEETEILDELKITARKIIDDKEDVSPTELWMETVKDRSQYQIITEFNSKTEKYVSTIEFHDKTFTKEDFDQVKAETRVACAALDELIELEFDEDDGNVPKTEKPKMEDLKAEVVIEKPPLVEETETVVNSSHESVGSSDDSTSDKSDDVPESLTIQSSKTREPELVVFYEPLTKRIQTVLENVAVYYVTSSYLM